MTSFPCLIAASFRDIIMALNMKATYLKFNLLMPLNPVQLPETKVFRNYFATVIDLLVTF